jgi:hypothetical protein
MDVDKADKYYREVLKLDPDNKDAKKGLELLHPKSAK